MAYCLMAPSHYLNQGWPTIDEIIYHSFQGDASLNTKNSTPHLVLKFVRLNSQPQITPWGSELIASVHTLHSYINCCFLNYLYCIETQLLFDQTLGLGFYINTCLIRELPSLQKPFMHAVPLLDIFEVRPGISYFHDIFNHEVKDDMTYRY